MWMWGERIESGSGLEFCTPWTKEGVRRSLLLFGRIVER